MTVSEALRRNLMRISYERELPIYKIAQMSGIPQTTMYFIIGGRGNTSLQNAFRISKALGCKVDDLIYGATE